MNLPIGSSNNQIHFTSNIFTVDAFELGLLATRPVVYEWLILFSNIRRLMFCLMYESVLFSHTFYLSLMKLVESLSETFPMHIWFNWLKNFSNKEKRQFHEPFDCHWRRRGSSRRKTNRKQQTLIELKKKNISTFEETEHIPNI